MPMFLRHSVPEGHLEKIECVEINKEIVEMATKHFGFTAGDGIIESVIGDAHEHVSTTKQKYDIVFVDVFTS